ncbi:unnamed protein product [Periconia digitata]|uniref:Phosphomethylpyrimidine kinase n=1 Tax=Periconia digitata TaxID=1303443 RepID=A0A9W4USN9_9PLEO|nr:unnamed protein product [Periconia digitata]
MCVKRILVIAGSDSSGGAGLEADQKVIAAHGCYAMTATTALTAQNTLGVHDVHHIPPLFLRKQIDACLDDIGVDVVKTGMLASADTVNMVADAFRAHGISNTVVDPVRRPPNDNLMNTTANGQVMVSTSGSRLLPTEAVQTLIEQLLPLTKILTPNLPEAKLLLQVAGIDFKEPETIDDIVSISQKLQSLGPEYVLLKGGHLPLTIGRLVSKNEADQDIVLNVLHGANETALIETPYQKSRNTHGTGCSLASAIACNLASGLSMISAVKKANLYVEAGIRTSKDLGKGSGPINHFHSTYSLPFAPGGFIDYLLQREDIVDSWKRYTHHEFVARMGDGTLPTEKFKHYLIQDYMFLSAQQVLHLQQEIKLHIDFCKDYGLSVSDLENQEEDQACTAYTRYVLDIGQSEDWLALQIALLPCLIGYGIIARRLFEDPETAREGNRYWKWIQTYVAEDYCEAMEIGKGTSTS